MNGGQHEPNPRYGGRGKRSPMARGAAPMARGAAPMTRGAAPMARGAAVIAIVIAAAMSALLAFSGCAISFDLDSREGRSPSIGQTDSDDGGTALAASPDSTPTPGQVEDTDPASSTPGGETAAGTANSETTASDTAASSDTVEGTSGHTADGTSTPKSSDEASPSESSGGAATPVASDSPSSPSVDDSIPIGISIGQRAPDFSLELRGGGRFNLSDSLGYPVLINVGATWCGPCLYEMPDIQRAYEDYGTSVRFIVVMIEYKDTVDGFFDDTSYTFPVAYDPDGIILDLYDIEFIPATWILGRDGVIIETAVGSEDYAFFSGWLDDALNN